jgi:hypothetical protein
MTTTSSRYSPEVQARAVRLVLEHEAEYPSQWSAIQSIAACPSSEQSGLFEAAANGGFGASGFAV